MMKLVTTSLVACAMFWAVNAHGSHGSSSQDPRPEEWALWHLEEEHREWLNDYRNMRLHLLTETTDISNFDPTSFFTLHDFNNDGIWTPDEIRRTYGLEDVSLKDTPESKRTEVVAKVLSIYDPEGNGHISKQQFVQRCREGKKLPDFGLGPGHHGDMEYEYEIHHFEKFHGPDTTEEDLIHPEDIEHFRMHDQLEEEQERIAIEQSQSIVEANIPLKFRKQQ